jgi:hypothetical protein
MLEKFFDVHILNNPVLLDSKIPCKFRHWHIAKTREGESLYNYYKCSMHKTNCRDCKIRGTVN